MAATLATELNYLQMTNGIRGTALALITDEDLRYALPGNPTLGEVFREIGEIQQSYLDSFKQLKEDWSYKHADKSVETSKEALTAWFKQLDENMVAALGTFSDADLDDKHVERGSDFNPTVREQMQIYGDAVYIFTGKVSVYLRALGKADEQWKSWFG